MKMLWVPQFITIYILVLKYNMGDEVSGLKLPSVLKGLGYHGNIGGV